MVRSPAALAAILLLAAGNPPAHAERLWASFYGAESGRLTASGAPFRPMGLTVAHPSLPFGTRLEVCVTTCVVCTVTDRGPAGWTHRQIDLSRGCARASGLERRGVGWARVRRLD